MHSAFPAHRSTLHALALLRFPTVMQGGQYCYPHLTEESAEHGEGDKLREITVTK